MANTTLLNPVHYLQGQFAGHEEPRETENVAESAQFILHNCAWRQKLPPWALVVLSGSGKRPVFALALVWALLCLASFRSISHWNQFSAYAWQVWIENGLGWGFLGFGTRVTKLLRNKLSFITGTHWISVLHFGVGQKEPRWVCGGMNEHPVRKVLGRSWITLNALFLQ